MTDKLFKKYIPENYFKRAGYKYDPYVAQKIEDHQKSRDGSQRGIERFNEKLEIKIKSPKSGRLQAKNLQKLEDEQKVKKDGVSSSKRTKATTKDSIKTAEILNMI